jgi:hypothetical protein
MVVFKDIMVSVTDGGKSTQDRDGNCERSSHSKCKNDRVVERMIDEKSADGVDEPTKA